MAENYLEKKFIDKAGVSRIWAKVKDELDKKANISDVNNIVSETNDALDSLDTKIKSNKNAIDILNGSSTTEGSVAYQIAQIVAGADTSFDTLKEIADWISTHSSDATEMNSNIKANADAIEELRELIGDIDVSEQIEAALKKDGVNIYATVEELNTLANKVDEVYGSIKALTNEEIDQAIASING